MALNNRYSVPTGTAAGFASLAGSSGLTAGEMYYLSDTKALMVALTTSTYVQLNGIGRHSAWMPAGVWAGGKGGNPSAAWSEIDCGTSDLALGVWSFDTTTQEYINGYIAMPKGWDQATISFTPHWTNRAGATTQTVQWGLGASYVLDSDALGGIAATTYATSVDTWLAQLDAHIGPESSAISIQGNTPGGAACGVALQFTRMVAGTDNMAGDADFIGALVHLNYNAATDN